MARRYRVLVRLIGQYLREKREELNLTQLEVARKLGYQSAQYISNIERGVALPPAKFLKKFVGIYHISDKRFLDSVVKAQSISLKETDLRRKRRKRD